MRKLNETEIHMKKQFKEQKIDTVQAQATWAKDVCVLCGRETIYDFTTPIDQRTFYVSGAGQLCRECFYKLYT